MLTAFESQAIRLAEQWLATSAGLALVSVDPFVKPHHRT